MSPRPRPAFALALATAMAGAAAGTAPLPVGADDTEEPIEYCYTEALTIEEVEAGATSVVECDDHPIYRRSGIILAVIYADPGLGGSNTTVGGTSCTGALVNFGTGHSWDNRISSTDLISCGYAKHYVNTGASGTSQLMTAGGSVNMDVNLNDKTSSIEYAP
ncbi:MAG TPA: hypothetical protein VK507_17270 [Iamia sp.]|nr:hypothetical protein [Iamia sp.]